MGRLAFSCNQARPWVASCVGKILQVPPRHLAEFLLPADLQVITRKCNHIGQEMAMFINIISIIKANCYQHVPDLLVIGTQETFPEKTEWEVGKFFLTRYER